MEARLWSGRLSQARLIASPVNLGFARGNNLALGRCRGRYIIILNPDTELVDNGFKEMALFMEANPFVSVWPAIDICGWLFAEELPKFPHCAYGFLGEPVSERGLS